MRKEKFSYIILVAEIAAIVWLHSVKSTENKAVTPDNIVEHKDRVPSTVVPIKYIQAVHK